MTKVRLAATPLAAAFTMLLTSCEKDSNSRVGETDTPPTNSSPTVSLQENFSVLDGAFVELTSSASDSDGSIASYQWTQTSGAVVSIADDTSAVASFDAPNSATELTLSFSLEVTDNGGLTATDSVDVTITPFRELNDTGRNVCGDYAYDGGSGTHNNDSDCALTQETGNGMDPIPVEQDGHFGRDADVNTNSDLDGHAGFSFTKLDAVSGADLAANAVSWGCVRDEVTELTWEVKTTDSGLRDNGNLFTWYNSTDINDAGHPGYGDTGTSTTTDPMFAGSDSCFSDSRCDTEKFVEDVNSLAQPLCGFTDWRLPTYEELLSISDFSRTTPSIDTDYFPNTTSNRYWSSTPLASGTDHARYVDTNFGVGSILGRTYLSYRVRLVRGY